MGGMQHGLRRTASSNTFAHKAEVKEELKKRDYLVESQLTFDYKFHQS
jgi:hypothetical protein